MFKKFTWGHGLVLALICFMIFILSLIYIYQSQKNTFDLVTDEYYQEEIDFQQQINAKNRTNELKETPQIKYDKTGIIITFPKENNSQNTKGLILLRHPSNKSKDFKTNLLLNTNNQIIIPKNILDKTKYELILNWQTNDLKYRKDFEIIWN